MKIRCNILGRELDKKTTSNRFVCCRVSYSSMRDDPLSDRCKLTASAAAEILRRAPRQSHN